MRKSIILSLFLTSLLTLNSVETFGARYTHRVCEAWSNPDPETLDHRIESELWNAEHQDMEFSQDFQDLTGRRKRPRLKQTVIDLDTRTTAALEALPNRFVRLASFLAGIQGPRSYAHKRAALLFSLKTSMTRRLSPTLIAKIDRVHDLDLARAYSLQATELGERESFYLERSRAIQDAMEQLAAESLRVDVSMLSYHNCVIYLHPANTQIDLLEEMTPEAEHAFLYIASLRYIIPNEYRPDTHSFSEEMTQADVGAFWDI